MTYRTTGFAITLALAGAIMMTAPVPSLARGKSVVISIGKRPADANGYFFFLGNAVDDSYVYDPPSARTVIKHDPKRPVRHRHRRT